jgi:OmpA-OmpF porin, OOP family
MNRAIHTKPISISCIAALFLPLAAMAQTGGSTTSDSYNSGYRSSAYDTSRNRSWLPYTENGYWGFNLGAPKYDKSCASGFECDDPSVGGKLYLGGQFNQWLGMEVGYAHFGKMDRSGGETESQGINLSLVGTLPLSEAFKAFGKVGTTYGWTDISADTGRTGSDNGFGLSYGAGLGYDINPKTQVVVEWDRHDFNYVGGDAGVDMYSVGMKFRF